MRIRKLSIQSDDHSRPLNLLFRKPEFDKNSEAADGNFFSILVGSNGTRKSQSLRDIVDLAFSSITRLRGTGLKSSSRNGELTFWRQIVGRSDNSLPSQILAVSGVATDRFPAQLTARRKTPKSLENPYRYIGPKTDNIISRSLGIRQLAESILLHSDRIKRRRKQLRSAFELLPIAHGLLFTFEVLSPESGTWTLAKIRKHITDKLTSSTDREHLDFDKTIYELYSLAKLGTRLELRLDLDDIDAIGMTPELSHTALNLALRTGILSVGDTYTQTKSGDNFPLLNFSSGQWHILSSLLFIALTSSDDTLIVADELENSLHPEWQREYLRLFNIAISGCKRIHTIVATHSPFVASSLPPEQAEVLQIRRNRLGNLTAAGLPQGPFGWTADEILENVFGLESTRSRLFSKKVERALELFGRGDRNNDELKNIVKDLSRRLDDLPADDVAANIILTIARAISN